MSAHVTVGYDGSPSAGEAVAWAAGAATARAWPLRIVASYAPALEAEPMAEYVTPEMHEVLRNSTERSLEDACRLAAARHPDLDVTPVVSPDPPTKALVGDVGADDLLVLGASKHRGAAAFWLGSTPRGVVRRSPCPVVVVRGGPTTQPSRVVVGIDGSVAADEALTWASAEATRHGSELVIVHAWDYPYPALDFGSPRGHDLMRSDAARVLDAAVTRARTRHAAAITGLLIEGSAASALLRTAAPGDVIVVGSRGRGAVASGLFGSTATAVLERAAVPVAVVRQRTD